MLEITKVHGVQGRMQDFWKGGARQYARAKYLTTPPNCRELVAKLLRLLFLGTIFDKFTASEVSMPYLSGNK